MEENERYKLMMLKKDDQNRFNPDLDCKYEVIITNDLWITYLYQTLNLREPN